MKTFHFDIHARRVGAIGLTSRFLPSVLAETKDEAVLKLYDTYEHISYRITKVEDHDVLELPAELPDDDLPLDDLLDELPGHHLFAGVVWYVGAVSSRRGPPAR